MLPVKPSVLLLTAVSFLAAGVPVARAAVGGPTAEYWDAAHLNTLPGSGGTGNWDLATPNWLYNTGTDTTYFNNSSTVATLFEGTAGTVNLDSSGVAASSIFFYTAGYVLQDAPGTSYSVATNGQVCDFASSGTVTISTPFILNDTFNPSLQTETGGTLVVSGSITAPGGIKFNEETTSGSEYGVNNLLGTVVLSGSNSISGTTTVQGGTLELNGASATVNNGLRTPNGGPVPSQVLGGTTGVTIISGALLYGASNQLAAGTPMTLNGGTFNLGTFSQDRANALGALTLSANSAIDFGSGTSTGSVLAFADSSEIAWSGKLSIYNFHGTPLVGGGLDQLFFGTSASGLTAAQVSDITFYAGGPGSAELGTGDLLSDGELTYTPSVVPEPSTWAGVLASSGLLGLWVRAVAPPARNWSQPALVLSPEPPAWHHAERAVFAGAGWRGRTG